MDRFLTCLKWASILWTTGVLILVLLSTFTLVFNWPRIPNVTPLNVEGMGIVLMLAPGPIGALIHYFLEKGTMQKPKSSGPDGNTSE